MKTTNSSTLYLRDLAHVRDGFAAQTNIVRQDGARGVFMSILQIGRPSTLTVANANKAMLPVALSLCRREMRVNALFDQSLFVRASINGVIGEGLMAACLTAV